MSGAKVTHRRLRGGEGGSGGLGEMMGTRRGWGDEGAVVVGGRHGELATWLWGSWGLWPWVRWLPEGQRPSRLELGTQ